MAHLPEKVIKLLEGGHQFWVATASASGVPNISIKGSGAVADSEHLCFADLYSRKTRTNLEQNPQVAIGIYDAQNAVAIQIKGRARWSDTGDLYNAVVARIKEKMPLLPAPTYVVEVSVDSVWDMTAGPKAGSQVA